MAKVFIKQTKEERLSAGMQKLASAFLSIAEDLIFEEAEDYIDNPKAAGLLTNPLTLNCKNQK